MPGTGKILILHMVMPRHLYVDFSKTYLLCFPYIKILFIDLFLAVLGLSCGMLDLSLQYVVFSLVEAHGAQLLLGMWNLSSLTRD